MAFELPIDPSTVKNYNLWRKDVLIWQKLTDVPLSKQGLSLQYACKGNIKIQEAVLAIDSEKVEGDDGFKNVLDVLDTLLKTSPKNEEMQLYQHFESIKRKEGQTIEDFIDEFDSLWVKIKRFGNVLSDNILSIKLMISSNLTETQVEIIKASKEYTDYVTLKKIMKRTFQDLPHISFENEFMSEENYKRKYQEGHQSNNTRENEEVLYSNYKKRKLSMYDGGSNILEWRNCCEEEKLHAQKEKQKVHNIVLFQSDFNKPQDLKLLTGETIGAGIIDCGATKTCCGNNWFKQLLELYSNEDKDLVSYKSAVNWYKFGYGPAQKASISVKFPVYFGQKQIFLEADVLEHDIPLIISKASLKRANSILDTQNDIVTMLGEKIQLVNTSSGHYAVPIIPYRRISKRSIENQNTSIASQVPLKFNEIVAIDISNHHKMPILHLIDLCSRYSVTVALNRLHPREIVDKITENWKSIFNLPEKMISDNPVFKSNEFCEVALSAGIAIFPLQSVNLPEDWSFVRQNKILCEKIKEIQSEVNCSVSVATAWATNLINSEPHIVGFSPSEIVFGLNLILPCLNDRPPQLCQQEYDEILLKYFTSQKRAYETYSKAQLSQKFRRALDRNSNVFIFGDYVFYRRRGEEEWQE